MLAMATWASQSLICFNRSAWPSSGVLMKGSPPLLLRKVLASSVFSTVLNQLCLRLQRGGGVRGWGRDDLGTGGVGVGEQGREGVDVVHAPSPAGDGSCAP